MSTALRGPRPDDAPTSFTKPDREETYRMKAVVLTGYGDIDKLEVRELPEPKVAPGELKVRMVGAGVNPVDWKMRSGALQAMMPLALPAVLGRDVSGEVVEVGWGVTHFSVGSRVMGLVMGAYAEFVVAPSDAWADVPAKMDLADAAALPLVLLTGAQLVEESIRPREGDQILVTGALGSVGRVAVFAAKARGAIVWAGVHGAQRAEASELGAHGVVALDDDADLATLPPLDSIADTLGGAEVGRHAVDVVEPCMRDLAGWLARDANGERAASRRRLRRGGTFDISILEVGDSVVQVIEPSHPR